MHAYQDIIRSYAQALKDNDCQAMLQLFSPEARVFSLLAGEQPPATFFRNLFDGSSRSTVEIKNIFFDPQNPTMAAAYLQIDALWGKKYPITFQAVDMFQFDANNKISTLRIIMDTHPVRVLKEKHLRQ